MTLTVLILLFVVPAQSLAGPCPFGISPQTAQRVFERMKQLSVGDGYHFEGVGTEQTAMVIEWSLNGTRCPPIRARIATCWSPLELPTFDVDVPSDLLQRCPGLQPVADEISKAPAARRGLRFFVSVFALTAALCVRRFGWIALTPTIAAPLYFSADLAVTLALGAAWLGFAVLSFDRDWLTGKRPSEVLGVLGLVPITLLLDYWLSSHGPGDLRLNLAAVWRDGVELRWGPAPIALFRLLGFALGGLTDSTIVWCNLVLSSFVPLMVYGISTQLGITRAAALAAAYLVAAHPLLLAFSGVLERQPIYLVAACGSTLALITFLKRGDWNRFAAFVLGTLLAITSRPEGAHVVILQLAVVLVIPASRGARRTAAAALVVLGSFALVYVHYALLSAPPSQYPLLARAPLLWTVVFDPDFTPLAWIVGWALGLSLGFRHRAAWVALITLLGLDITWRWTGIYYMFVGHVRQVASARYETILLVPFALGIALFIQAILNTRASLRLTVFGFFAVFTAVTFRQPYDTLLRPFTIDYEYRFLKKQALTLPPRSHLYVFDSPVDDIGLIDAHLVGQFVGSPVSFKAWSERRCDDLLQDGVETYLYVGSSCGQLNDAPGRDLSSSADYGRWLQDCQSISASPTAELVEEVTVPARNLSWHSFKNPTQRLALYRLVGPASCRIGPQITLPRAAPAQP